MKYKVKPLFNIKIKEIQDEKNKNIEKKIKEIKDDSLNYQEKKIKVLLEEKTTTYVYEKFDINIKEIKAEKEREFNKKLAAIKDSSLSDFEKRLYILSQEKTTTYLVDEKESKNVEKNSPEIKKKLKDSELEIPEIIVKPKYKIDIETYIRLDQERFQKIIKEKYNNLNLSEEEKYLKALEEDRAPTIDLVNSKVDINKEEKEDQSNVLIYEADKNNEKSRDEIPLNCSVNSTFDTSKNQINISSMNVSTDKTIENDYLNKSFSFYEKTNQTINESMGGNKKLSFNKIRAKFYLENNLDDIPINIEEEKVFTPKIYYINEKKYAFVYLNNYMTYYITESHFLLSHQEKNTLDEINKEDIKFHKQLGLYFCGNKENVPTENGIIKKFCAPNEFMCKDCMEKNKSFYSIKKKYLININGRVSKINKKKYHCFGHFIYKNQIEDCITSFSCEACKMLDEFEQYYNRP